MALTSPTLPQLQRNRVIWDGRDVNNIKYFNSPATEMRLVGDGINQLVLMIGIPNISANDI